MGRIGQSHALKASGVTTSKHFVISRLGASGPLPKAFCALVFDAVLDIRALEKTTSETYSELLRRRIVLTLGRDNSKLFSKLGAE